MFPEKLPLYKNNKENVTVEHHASLRPEGK